VRAAVHKCLHMMCSVEMQQYQSVIACLHKLHIVACSRMHTLHIVALCHICAIFTFTEALLYLFGNL
jgi:hypothetical protein